MSSQPQPNHTRDLLSLLARVETLIDTVSCGEYGEKERQILVQLIADATRRTAIAEIHIGKYARVSAAVVRSTKGGGRPKLHNFLGIAYGLRETIADELVKIGVVSGTYKIDRNTRIRFLKLTSVGSIQTFATQLQDFELQLKQVNDPDAYLTQEVKATLVELLEAILAQLKGPFIELGTLRVLGISLKAFSKAVATKVAGHATEASANAIIVTISQLFGFSS